VKNNSAEFHPDLIETTELFEERRSNSNNKMNSDMVSVPDP